MIKTKLKNVIAAEAPLSRVLSEKLPAKIAYRMSRLLSKVTSEVREFNATRERMVKQMGEADAANPTMFTIKDSEKLKEFAEGMNKILEEDVEIDRDPLDINEFGNAQLAASDLAALQDFITEKEATA